MAHKLNDIGPHLTGIEPATPVLKTLDTLAQKCSVKRTCIGHIFAVRYIRTMQTDVNHLVTVTQRSRSVVKLFRPKDVCVSKPYTGLSALKNSTTNVSNRFSFPYFPFYILQWKFYVHENKQLYCYYGQCTIASVYYTHMQTCIGFFLLKVRFLRRG